MKEIVFSQLLYGVPNIDALFYLSRLKNFGIFNLLLLKPPTKTLTYSTLTYSKIVNLVDYYFPISSWGSSLLNRHALFVGRIAMDSFLILAQGLHYGYGLKKSFDHFATRVISPSIGLKHTVISLASLHGIMSTLIQGTHLYQGIQLFQSLDDTQQEAVLKVRSVNVLSREKRCNAVVIDGISSKWGELLDDIPAPFTAFLYEKCHTYTYQATSDKDLCNILKKAHDDFDSPIDILTFNPNLSPKF